MTAPNATLQTAGQPGGDRTALNVPALASLLRQQLALYQQLAELSRQQAQLLDQGAVDGVLAVLGQRQKLIEALTGLGQQIDPFRDRLPALWPTLAPAHRDELSSLLDQIQGLVKGILDQDGRDRNILASARDKVGGELRQTSSAGRAVSAYAMTGRTASAPRFADRQG